MNLASIALLPRVFNLCEISMLSGLTGTSRTAAILCIASSGELYALPEFRGIQESSFW